MSSKLIFVVDDDSLSRDFLTEATRSMGHEVQAFENGALAMQATDRRVPDLVLSDVRMPVMDGIQLTRTVQDRFPGLPVVLVTAHAALDTAVEALRLGASDFLIKPCSPDNLELVVNRVLRIGQIERGKRLSAQRSAGRSTGNDHRAEPSHGATSTHRRTGCPLPGHRPDLR